MSIPARPNTSGVSVRLGGGASVFPGQLDLLSKKVTYSTSNAANLHLLFLLMKVSAKRHLESAQKKRQHH